MSEILIKLIIEIFTIIGVSGIVSFVTIRATKKKAQAEADQAECASQNDHLDMTEKILQKYQGLVLSQMTEWEKQSQERAKERAEQRANDNKAIIERLDDLSSKYSDMSEFLNGDFAEFQIRKRNERGQFTSSKTLRVKK